MLKKSNIKHGEEIFFGRGTCLACHQVKGKGVALGPDLNGISKRRDTEYIIRSILLPDEYIVEGFQQTSLELKNGQTEITSAAFASMGVAIPLAIGAATTKPDKQILVIVGDGSIELNIQELKTISEYNLNIKIFLNSSDTEIQLASLLSDLYLSLHKSI